MKKKTLLPVIKAGVSFVLACSLVASPGLSYAQTTNSMVVALERPDKTKSYRGDL